MLLEEENELNMAHKRLSHSDEVHTGSDQKTSFYTHSPQECVEEPQKKQDR